MLLKARQLIFQHITAGDEFRGTNLQYGSSTACITSSQIVVEELDRKARQHTDAQKYLPTLLLIREWAQLEGISKILLTYLELLEGSTAFG